MVTALRLNEQQDRVKKLLGQNAFNNTTATPLSVISVLGKFGKKVLSKVEQGQELTKADMDRLRAALDTAKYAYDKKHNMTYYRFNKFRKAQEASVKDAKPEATQPKAKFTEPMVASTYTVTNKISPSDIDVTPRKIDTKSSITNPLATSSNNIISDFEENMKSAIDDEVAPKKKSILVPTLKPDQQAASRGEKIDRPSFFKSMLKNFSAFRIPKSVALVASAAIMFIGVGMNHISPQSEYSQQDQQTVEVTQQSQTDSTATRENAEASVAIPKMVITASGENVPLNVGGLNAKGSLTKETMDSDSHSTFDGQSNYTNSAYLQMQLNAIDGWKSSVNAALEELGNELPKKFADIVEKQQATELASQHHPSQDVAEANSPAIDETSVASVEAGKADQTVRTEKTITITGLDNTPIQKAGFSPFNSLGLVEGSEAPANHLIKASLAEQSESDKSSTIDTSDFNKSDVAGEELAFNLADFNKSDVAVEELAFNLADFNKSDVAGEELAAKTEQKIADTHNKYASAGDNFFPDESQSKMVPTEENVFHPTLTPLFKNVGQNIPQEIQDHLKKAGKYGEYDAYRFLSKYIQGEDAYSVVMDGMKDISMSGQGKVSRLAADAFNSTAYMQKQYNVTVDTTVDLANVKITPASKPTLG